MRTSTSIFSAAGAWGGRRDRTAVAPSGCLGTICIPRLRDHLTARLRSGVTRYSSAKGQGVGQEVSCTAIFGNQKSQGRAYLETDALIFRGAFRLAIPYGQMTSVQAKGSRLRVRFPQGVATFDLGTRAQQWAQKILHPKSLIDKLGVRPDDRVAVVRINDANFLRQLRSQTDRVALGEVTKDLDAIFLQADGKAALDRLRRLRTALKPAGGIWVVAPKGRKEITETDVLAAGQKAGLVDVKVVRFSETHTAHKFVIPRAKRSVASSP